MMGARTSNFENVYFLLEIHCTSMQGLAAAPKAALVPASHYNYNAARLYSSTHTKFD